MSFVLQLLLLLDIVLAIDILQFFFSLQTLISTVLCYAYAAMVAESLSICIHVWAIFVCCCRNAHIEFMFQMLTRSHMG